jgi:hypothetical protein
MVNRRGFLGLILASGVAPAVVRAQSIMAVRPVLHRGRVEWRECPAIEPDDAPGFYDSDCGLWSAAALGGMKICCDDETLEERAREYEKLHACRGLPDGSTE